MKAPWSCQVELTEGCNRFCSFCGIRGIRDGVGTYHHMTAETAHILALQAADFIPRARYEFAMHGEATMNPHLLAILATFRQCLPAAQMQLTTNGRTMMGRMQEKAEALFAAGLDFIVLDTYEPERLALQAEAFALAGITVLDFYRDCLPRHLSPYNNHRRRLQRTIFVMDDLGLRDGEARSRRIVNQAGNSQARPVPTVPYKRMCTLPFREVTVAWNGDVNLCCEDWSHRYVCGNILTEPLASIWSGERFAAARRILFSRSRDFIPCRICDKGAGARVGLVERQDPPSEADYRVVRGGNT